MTSSSLKRSPLEFLSTMCDEYSSIPTRFAVLSMKGNYLSNFHKMALLFIEYMQIISPVLFLTLFFANPDETLLPNIVNYVAKLLNPTFWFLSDKLDNFNTVVLCVILGYFLLRQALIVRIGLTASKKMKAPHEVFIVIWRYLVKVQGRVLFYFVTSLWVNAVILANENDEKGFWRSGIKVMTSIIFAIEFLLSFRLFYKYEDKLPQKHFLSGKTQCIELLTLIQKTILHILIIFLYKNSLTSLWVYASVNLAFDGIRNVYFFAKLPLYSFRAMYYQRTVLMLVSSLNLAVFIGCIVYSIDNTIRCLPIVMVLWIVMFALAFKASGAYLQKRFVSLVLDTKIETPHLLIHRLVAIKELRRKAKLSSEHDEKNTWEYLLLRTVNFYLHKILEVDGNHADINSKNEVNMMYRDYLEKLMQRYPKDDFIKLYTARFYVKKFGIYGDAIKISRSLVLSDKSSDTIKINAELLLLDIQDFMKRQLSSKESLLDLRQYVFENSLLAKAKELMIQQANLQAKICAEIKKESPDLSSILQRSLQLESHRKITTRHMNKMLRNISEYNLQPLALCAQYQLTLNHSISEYIHFCKEISRKSLKYKEALDDERMLQNNIFTKDVAFYLISGNDSDTGVILYASEAARNISGRDPQSIIGTNLIIYTPPCLHPMYATFYSTFGERQFKQGFGTIAKSFHYHSQNYLVEVDYYLQVYPFATQGFCFSLLLKPIDSKKDFMYIKENGDIDCSTKEIGELFDIIPSTKKTSRVNIKELSEELALANEAFNMMTAQEKQTKASARKNSMALTIEAAREIYSLYSTTGRDVFLQKPFSGNSYSYNCKISTITYGPISVQLFTVERNRNVGDPEAFGGRASPSPRISLVKRYEDMKTLDIPYENSKADETEVFDYSEEKAPGWTDIQAVYSKDFTTRDCTHRSSTRLLTGLTGTERARTTTRNFSSTLMPQDPADMMMAKFPPPATATENKVVIAVPKFSQSTGAKNDKFAQNDNKSGAGGQFGQQSSLNTSNWSRFSYKKRMSGLYKTSLELQYIPKFFRLISPFFFLFFLGAIIGEVLLKVSLDSDVNNITLKKEILRNSEARDFQLTSAQSTIRLFWELSKGSIDASALGPFGPFMIPLYGYYVGTSLTALATINQNLLLDTTQLDEEIRDFAFAGDVKMYDNYFEETPVTYTSVSNFQAMDRVIETGLTIVELSATPNTPEANETANFLFRNMLNDVLVKNTKISEMILESLNDEYEDSHLKIDLYLILLMLSFGGFLFVLLAILRRQYHKEVGHLSALCRLDQNKLTIVLQSFVTFKEQLEDQGFSDWNSGDIHLYLNRFDETRHTIAKREGGKDINFKGMVKKYTIYVAKLFLFIFAMFGIFIGNFASTRSSVNSFKIQQAQIYYSDHYQTRICLAFIAARELFFTNNIAEVEGVPAKDELVEILGEMSIIRQEAVQTLSSIQQSDLTDEISALALVDACPLIDPTLASYCQTLKNQGIRTAFIYLLDSMESILKNQLNTYEVSDKSAASLKELQEDNLELLIALYAVINAANTQISTLNNQSFENRVDTVVHNTLMGLVGSIIAMVVVGVLMWKLLLEKWRGGINRFKNVLKVLPPELVLSSFILKTFLVRTSQGLLEAFKNDL